MDECFVGSVSGQASAREAGCVGKGLPMFVFYCEGVLYFPFFVCKLEVQPCVSFLPKAL